MSARSITFDPNHLTGKQVMIAAATVIVGLVFLFGSDIPRMLELERSGQISTSKNHRRVNTSNRQSDGQPLAWFPGAGKPANKK